MALCSLLPLTYCRSSTFEPVLTRIRRPCYRSYGFDAILSCTVISILILCLLHRLSRHWRVRTTQLRGPPSESFLYGVGKCIRSAKDPGALYEAWAKEYGPAYAVPSTLGSKRIILCDPKAIGHFHSKETVTYIQTPLTKESFKNLYGKGLLWAHGEDHKRQRKSLAPGFNIAAIRRLTPTFYESAYKAKEAWDALVEASDGDSSIIEVQTWMNHMSLDNVGLACLSYDFGSLEGKRSSVTDILDAFSASPRATVLNKGLHLLSQTFPILARVPTSRSKLVKKLNDAMVEIASSLLARTQREIEKGVVKEERSVMGLLIKGTKQDSQLHLSKEEVKAQMKMLLVAGYETTSISMTWALLELARNPDIQTNLRNELLEHGGDPTYDQLTNGLPYLDAVVHEVLRLHLAIVELTRVANEDDIIPLSEPVRTKSGELVDSLTVAKGTLVAISFECMNRSEAIWGEDAKLFRPSRWLEDAQGRNGIPAKAKQIHGHHHLLTFVDGPRSCLGKHFALAEIKVVLAVFIKNFVFELRDGPDSKIDIGRGVFPRPKIAGEVGCRLPLRVRQYVASE